MKRPAAAALHDLRAVVVSGHKGQDVRVDTDPRCQHCGKRQGEYFGVPWSVKCRGCGQQAKRD